MGFRLRGRDSSVRQNACVHEHDLYLMRVESSSRGDFELEIGSVGCEIIESERNGAKCGGTWYKSQ